MTIGAASGPSYGFNSSVGDLDDPTFTTAGGDDHRIVSIVTSSGHLVVGIDTALSAVDKSKLVLQVCDQAYAFGPVTPTGTDYQLATSALNWSPYAERTIYLSQDTAGPDARRGDGERDVAGDDVQRGAGRGGIARE